MISREKRIEFWDYLTARRANFPRGVTMARLGKIKPEILADDYFWFQVIERCGAADKTAKEFYTNVNMASEYSKHNFYAMCRERISNKSLIKTQK